MSGSPIATCGMEPIEEYLQPVKLFFQSKTTAGILLIASAVLALAWANSPWGYTYTSVWETKFTVGYGSAELSKPLLLWVNDGLMAVFFFVVGLEIKREFMVGELSTRSQAILPIAAAVGGMVVPASIYAAVNFGGPGIQGWGVPMATDIAFALGILALLGDRVPYQLKIFLTAVAIVDDLGAVLVIALFYTSDISFWLLLASIGLLALAFVGNRVGVRSNVFYFVIGALIWLAVLKSGVHSTIAGVLMAFAIPARTRCDAESFQLNASNVMDDYRASLSAGPSVLTNHAMQTALVSLQNLAVRAQTPLQRLEHGLHSLVDFGIMPIFALANAGVILSADMGPLLTSDVTLGTALGLFVGKPVGILLSVWAIVKLTGGLPAGLTWRHFIGAGFLAGIGFTMSLFIAALAFKGDAAMLTSAKTAILGASTLAGLAGFAILRSMPSPRRTPRRKAESAPEPAADPTSG